MYEALHNPAVEETKDALIEEYSRSAFKDARETSRGHRHPRRRGEERSEDVKGEGRPTSTDNFLKKMLESDLCDELHM